MNKPPMLSKQEIIDYASRYVASEDVVDFAHDNDLFCMVARKIASDKPRAADEGWGFQGYGVCLGYTVDEQEIPAGKWLWMHFISLATFPPSMQTLKLQPPHAVKGGFQNPDRTEEIRIIKINLRDPAPQTSDAATAKVPESPQPRPKATVLEFRKKPRPR